MLRRNNSCSQAPSCEQTVKLAMTSTSPMSSFLWGTLYTLQPSAQLAYEQHSREYQLQLDVSSVKAFGAHQLAYEQHFERRAFKGAAECSSSILLANLLDLPGRGR